MVKLRDFNIVYGGILASMLVAEMTSIGVFQFYVIRFLQVFILINILGRGFKLLEKAVYFILPAIVYIIYSIFYFDDSGVAGDFFNIIWWVMFMSIINYSIITSLDFEKFKNVLFKSTFLLTTLTASFGLYKLYLISQGIILPFMEIEMADGTLTTLLGTSLNIDYNVYSIGLFCGLFSGMYCYRNTLLLKFKILYSVAILVIISSAMLSSSRRGLIIGVFMILFLLIWSCRSSSWSKLKNIRQRTSLKLVKAPWLILISSAILLVIVVRVDTSSLIESSSEITTLFNRLESVNSITSKDNNTRGNRWSYALEYYGELPMHAQLFGDGFSYLKAYGKEFGEGEVDHPHNVWISSLLYGGILGFLLTTWLTIYVLSLFFYRRKIFSEIVYWYILFLILNFTSSNSIYSSRLFVILLLFPFLNFCYKKYNQDANEINALTQRKLTHLQS